MCRSSVHSVSFFFFAMTTYKLVNSMLKCPVFLSVPGSWYAGQLHEWEWPPFSTWWYLSWYLMSSTLVPYAYGSKSCTSILFMWKSKVQKTRVICTWINVVAAIWSYLLLCSHRISCPNFVIYYSDHLTFRKFADLEVKFKIVDIKISTNIEHRLILPNNQICPPNINFDFL
jgi:hypothetical protein